MQSAGMGVRPFHPLAEPRLRIVVQPEALSDGVVGSEIRATAQRDWLVELEAVEEDDVVGVQAYSVSGDKEPVQQRCRVLPADPCRQLGEVGDERLDVVGPATKHRSKVEPVL